ncbi:hypothetical protein K1T71_013602 [Dendrolimus kikuchii]|uniref:Uncharacterized protein n=1 Tax=Dendrolimus kikuchii TaxID=765133 RepID=A0ACC1CH34_9NEOP|nr:hypothetical protein K1T71_013602 [Dendrolimus kikuchii]
MFATHLKWTKTRANPNSQSALVVTTEDVRNAVGSFQSGSAGGLDGLTPQHLKDLIGVGCGEARESLLRNLTALVNFMLSGKVVNEITDILYGANLCALKKKDGGIRPIAVGTVYRRLAAKCCCKKKAEDLKLYFQPNQLGFGSRGGCEAAVHALRTFLQHNGGDLVLKVDVKNAFNSVDRSALLSQIKDQIPDCYHFLWQCYSQNSKLIFQDNVIYSKTGCQQGDPLGPAIFSLAIHPIITRLKSKFNVWYLDDGTLGGEVDDVLEDFTILTKELKTIGLEINLSKCEYYISNTEPREILGTVELAPSKEEAKASAVPRTQKPSRIKRRREPRIQGPPQSVPTCGGN